MKTYWTRLWIDAALAGALVGGIVWFLYSQHSLEFQDGVVNSGEWISEGLIPMFWLAMATILELLLAVARVYYLARRDGWFLTMARLGLYAALLSVLFLFLASHRFSANSGFRGGLRQWARVHVDAPAIRSWLRTVPQADVDKEGFLRQKAMPVLLGKLQPEFVVIRPDHCSVWYGGGFMHWGFTIEKSAAKDAPYTGQMGPPSRFAPGSYVWYH